MGKMGGSARIREAAEERAKLNGVPYIHEEFDMDAYTERRKMYDVKDKEFQRTYDSGYYYYNFRVQIIPGQAPHEVRAFKELHKFIVNGRPNLAKDLNLNEFDMESLSKGKEVKCLSWHFEVPGKTLQLRDFAGSRY